jgi:hypothetical protein
LLAEAQENEINSTDEFNRLLLREMDTLFPRDIEMRIDCFKRVQLFKQKLRELRVHHKLEG